MSDLLLVVSALSVFGGYIIGILVEQYGLQKRTGVILIVLGFLIVYLLNHLGLVWR